MESVIFDLLTIANIAFMFIGVAAGIIIGAIPGLNTVFAITIILPLTFSMDPASGTLLLLGAYCGSVYGGSITAILLNTPGTAGNAATVADGHALAKQGKAGDALKISLIVSVIGGLVSAIVLLLFAPVVAEISLQFGPPEIFSLCVFGLMAVIGVSDGQVAKGILMALVGLLISTVGIDATEGVPRFIFGQTQLLGGLNSTIIMLGLYAISEMMVQSKICISKVNEWKDMIQYNKATIKIIEILKYWKIMLKSTIIGIVIGIIPGTGGGIASWLAYNESKRASKTPEEFGKGSIEGVVAAECANNSVTGATLIPLLALGIPGDVGVAVLLGALTMQNIIPGPDLFTSGNSWVYVIMGGMIAINLIMWFQGQVFVNVLTKIVKIPKHILVPAVVVMCVLGGYATSTRHFDVLILIIFGLVGYFLKTNSFPMAPLVIGMILGKLMESNLRRSLILSDGTPAIFFNRPISAVILVLALLSLLYPIIAKLIKKIKEDKSAKV